MYLLHLKVPFEHYHNVLVSCLVICDLVVFLQYLKDMWCVLAYPLPPYFRPDCYYQCELDRSSFEFHRSPFFTST